MTRLKSKTVLYRGVEFIDCENHVYSLLTADTSDLRRRKKNKFIIILKDKVVFYLK